MEDDTGMVSVGRGEPSLSANAREGTSYLSGGGRTESLIIDAAVEPGRTLIEAEPFGPTNILFICLRAA